MIRSDISIRYIKIGDDAVLYKILYLHCYGNSAHVITVLGHSPPRLPGLSLKLATEIVTTMRVYLFKLFGISLKLDGYRVDRHSSSKRHSS